MAAVPCAFFHFLFLFSLFPLGIAMASGGVGQGFPQGGFSIGHGQGLLGGISRVPLAMGPSSSLSIVPQAPAAGAAHHVHLSADPDWLFKELYDSCQDHGDEYMK